MITKFIAFCVVVGSQFSLNDARDQSQTSVGFEHFREYHFHTYFNEHDPVQVAQAIELRNEIIANCVSKRIVGVPLHYHYDPENPILERKSSLNLSFDKHMLRCPNYIFKILNQITMILRDWIWCRLDRIQQDRLKLGFQLNTLRKCTNGLCKNAFPWPSSFTHWRHMK